MKKFIFTFLIVLSGCSSAGPYVTNISSDGAGGLIIEKCGAVMNGFTGTVSTGVCSTHQIVLQKRSSSGKMEEK